MTFNLSKKNMLLWSVIGILLVISSYILFRYTASHPSTDDAYVQANIVNIAAQVTGPIEHIYVKDHQIVQQGQLLFTIDPRPYQIAVKKAAAVVLAQQAALRLATQNAHRLLPLVRIGQATQASGDQAQSQLDGAQAELAANEAQLAQAQLDLEHTHITAPLAGVISQFLLQPGNNVLANMTLFTLIEQNNFWVDANFKETQIARVKSGQPVKIVLDMFPHQVFHGVVNAVSSASGSVFSLLPPENASGNWVKVTQRFPVKINILNPNPAYPLRAGATATVTINTSA